MRSPSSGRLRAALSLGLMWGLGWGAVSLMVSVVEYWFPIRHGDLLMVLDNVLFQSIGGAIVGALCGMLFSGLLALLGGSRRFDGLSLWRVAIIGGIATAWLGLLDVDLMVNSLGGTDWTMILAMAAGFGTVGGLSSALTLSVARRGAQRRIVSQERLDLIPGD